MSDTSSRPETGAETGAVTGTMSGTAHAPTGVSFATRGMRALASREPGRAWVLGAWATWTVALAVVVGRHEPWRDELQAWGIARDSSSPVDIVRIVADEGHPPFWHLLLWPIAHVTREPVMLQLTALVIGSAAVFLVLRFFPVAFWLRCAVVVGYMPLYEWSTIARNYSLAFLLGVVAAVLLSGPVERRPWAVVPALLLGATNGLALPLAFGLCLAAIAMGDVHRRRPRVFAGLTGTTVVAAALVVGYVWQGPKRLPSAFGVRDLVGLPAKALLPLPPSTTFWWGRTEWTFHQNTLFGLAILVVATALLAVSLPAILVWASGTGGYLFLVVAFGVPIETRHVSVIALSLLIAVWVAVADPRRRRVSSRWPARVALAATVAVLGVSGWSTVRAVGHDLTEPFSGAPAAADWIAARAEGPVAILCASSAPLCSSVAMTLDVPAYLEPDGEPFTWVDFGARTVPFPLGDLSEAVALLEQRTGRDVFVVTLPDWEPEGCVHGFFASVVQTEPVIVCSPTDIE